MDSLQTTLNNEKTQSTISNKLSNNEEIFNKSSNNEEIFNKSSNNELILQDVLYDWIRKLDLDKLFHIEIKLGKIIGQNGLNCIIDNHKLEHIVNSLSKYPIKKCIFVHKYFWNNNVLVSYPLLNNMNSQINNMNSQINKNYKIDDEAFQNDLIDYQLIDGNKFNLNNDFGISCIKKKKIKPVKFSCRKDFNLKEKLFMVHYMINQTTQLYVNLFPDYITINIDIHSSYLLANDIKKDLVKDSYQIIKLLDNIL